MRMAPPAGLVRQKAAGGRFLQTVSPLVGDWREAEPATTEKDSRLTPLYSAYLTCLLLPLGDARGRREASGEWAGIGDGNDQRQQKKIVGLEPSERLASSPRICLTVKHRHSASGTAKFAPVHASREQVVGERAQKGKKSQNKNHPIGLPTIKQVG